MNDPTGKDKRKKKAVDIWCEGEVVQIANGTTDKETPKCKKLLMRARCVSSGLRTSTARFLRRRVIHG